MTDLERYLVEEVATDFADGHFSRREAMRRLGLLGVEAVAAASLLSACGGDAPRPAEPGAPALAGPAAAPSGSASAPASAEPTAAVPAPVVLPPSSPVSAITFPGPEGRTLRGGWATAAKPRAGVLVIHENKGLNDHTRHVAGRFAHEGYAALAIDLLSAEGGTESLGDPANATAALGKAPPERLVADALAGIGEIARRAPGVKLGAIGFCFGGAMSWRLVASKDPRLAAVAPFYGPFPEGAEVVGSRAAVLGVFAEDDERVNKTRDAARTALEKAKLVHELVTYPKVGHAFFNDTGKRYDAAAAAAAWNRALEWFGRYLG